MTSEKIPVGEESKVPTIYVIHDNTVPLEKGYYYGVHVLLHFNKEGGLNSKEGQVDVDLDPDEEDMEDVILYNKR